MDHDQEEQDGGRLHFPFPFPAPPHSSPLQRSVGLSTSNESLQREDVPLVPQSQSLSPGTHPPQRARVGQQSPAYGLGPRASARPTVDDASSSDYDGYHNHSRPTSRRPSSHSAFMTVEPHAMAPPLARMANANGNNRSTNDLYAESPPGTPSNYSPHSSWLPPSMSNSPHNSWMPRSGRNSPFGANSLYGGNLSYGGAASMPSQEVLRPLFPDTPSGFFDRDWVKEGLIVKLHTRDDAEHLPNWKRYLFYLAPFFAIATLAIYWLYFGFRMYCVLAAQKQAHRAFPLAWVFIAIEISVAIPVFMQSFWSIFILKKRTRPKLRLIGNDVPTVDVFITCCGEEVDLIIDTARAACDLDYPPDKFRVVILDDAKDTALANAVVGLNETYHNCYYRARTKIPGVPHHFKAGNLNYGLEEVLAMPGGASQYVAALDADMIPEQHWLRAIVPHLLNDPKMALACPPQLFYNVPPSDPLCQSLDFFVHVSEPIKDALGVAWCTGSGYVLRRDALEDIGMFPKGSLAEDVATSTLMLGKGWKTAYIHEPLQFGTVPDSYGAHLKQRTRWAIGTVDTSFKLKFCLYGDEIKCMTFYQRMSSFIYAVLSLFNIFLTLSLFAMPVVLITGNALVAYATEDQLRWLIRACFAAFIMNRICEFVLFIPSGYNCGQRGGRSQLWMSPYIALTILRSFVLPTWLGGQTQAFKPSGSLKSELNERDPLARANVFRRVKVITINYLAGYHILYVYFCLAAVTLTTIRCLIDQYTVRDQLVCLLTHAFWPPLAWIMVVSAFWVPVTYAFDPPSMPDREALLKRDPKTHVAHPTKESKKTAFKPQTALFEMEYALTTGFTALVFAAGFFY